MNGKIATAAISALMLISLISVFQAGTASALDGSITIDGVIDEGEWDGAVSIPVAGDMGTVKLLATTDYLYVLFDLADSNDARTQYAGEVGNDQISININPTDGGSWGFPYDLIFETSALSAGDGGHHMLPWNPKVNSGISSDGWATRWFPNDAQENLPNNLESATTYSGGQRITEWKLPLASIGGLAPGGTLKIGGAIDVGNGNSYVYPIGLAWDNAATYETYTARVKNENTGFYFQTIQDAINVALLGDTVLVGPGTYDEAITIDTDNLVLQSETKLGAVIRPTTYPGWGKGAITILANGVTVDGFEIDGTTVYDTGILGWETSGLTIKNNKIHGAVYDWHGCGILLFSWGNSGTVYNNLIENNEVYDTGRMGIMICDYDGTNYTVTSGNIITGNIVHDVWKVAWGDHGGGIQINVAKNCSITNNEVYNVENGQRGIYMFGSATGNIITNNTIRDNPIGIQLWISGEGGTPINWGGNAPASPEVHYNNIYNNDSGAINSNIQGTSMVMDATLNWWGDPTGPRNPTTNPSATGDDVSDYVDYTPWLDAPYLTGVARSWNVQNVDTEENFNSIQAAINAAELGDTVLVYPGTYEEYILIDNPLTIRSTGGAEETIIDGIGFRYMVRIYSSDVTFEGFTVTNPTYEGGADASGILIGAYLRESVDNVHILNNIVKAVRNGIGGAASAFGATGINIGRAPLSNVVVSGNTIENIHNPEGASSDHTCGINVWDGAENVLISNNAISDIKYNGIMLEYASNVRVENNSITECETGIRVEPYGGATVSDLTIHLNTFENNGEQLIDQPGDLDIAEILANNTFDRAVIVETASYLPFIWSSIQDAIGNASAGDTVLVYSGTYNENINIDKSLTVRSVEGAKNTIINAQGVPIAVLINGADTVATFDGFTVDDYDTVGILAGAFRDTLQEVPLGDDPLEVHILNNIVKPPTIAPPHNNNIQVGGGTTGTVIGNEVSGALLESPDWTGSGIIVASSSNVLVSNNYVHNSEAGIVILGYAEYQGRPAAQNNLIENNLVESNECGISVQANSIGTIIRYNDVLNNDFGIESMAYDLSWPEHSTPSGTEIYYNNIVGNENYGVQSLVYWHDTGEVLAEQVDATLNWWGHPSGPRRDRGNPNCKAGRGDRVSENVRYHPWLSKPFQTVLEKHVGHYGFEGRYLEKGWNTLSVPIYLDNNAWEEIAAYLDENIAYRFNASTQAWELMTTDSKLDPLDAIYIRMNSENSVPLVVSVSITNPPVKELKRGWNLIGLAAWEEENMLVDQALVSVEWTPNGNRGYTIVVNPSLNRESWTVYTIGQPGEKPLMNKNKGYWVYMENPGNLAGFSTTPLPFWEPE